MSQAFYILFGLTILALANLGVTLFWVLFYFRVANIKEAFDYKLRLVSILSGVNLVFQFLGLVAFSSMGILPYTITTFVLSVIGYLVVMKYGYKYHILENVIIATSLAIVLNPIWLSIFGII